jgi:hypothetical protein
MTHEAQQLSLDDKLNLIKSRARLLGFRRHDLEDAVQEVMLAVLEFEYAPEKSNGATETTALTTVIDRCPTAGDKRTGHQERLDGRAGILRRRICQARSNPCGLQRDGRVGQSPRET